MEAMCREFIMSNLGFIGMAVIILIFTELSYKWIRIKECIMNKE